MIEQKLKQPIWKPLDRAVTVFNGLSSALNALGTVWILALMLLICADVIGRAFFRRPIAGVPEMVSLSIVGIVFLQLASTLRSGKMTRSDMLLNTLMKRVPKLGYVLELIFNVAGAYIVYIIFRASYPRFLTAVERGEFVGAVGHFTAPTWPVKLILVVGAAALALQFVINSLKCFMLMLRPGNESS